MLTRVDDAVHELLGLEPMVEAAEQTEDDAVVAHVRLAEAVEERRLREQELDRRLRVLRLEACVWCACGARGGSVSSVRASRPNESARRSNGGAVLKSKFRAYEAANGRAPDLTFRFRDVKLLSFGGE